jgi:hypothetical protein
MDTIPKKQLHILVHVIPDETLESFAFRPKVCARSGHMSYNKQSQLDIHR